MAEFTQMVQDVRNAKALAQGPDYTLTKEETDSRVFRRSLVAVADIKKGEMFTNENIRSIRPAQGLPPKYYKMVLGKTASCDIKFGEPVTAEKVDGFFI